MSNSQEGNELLQQIKESLDECGMCMGAIHETEEYKVWEQTLEKYVANIRAIAHGCDPEQILRMEVMCLNFDLKMNENASNESGLRFDKHAKFQCLCALHFLREMRAEPDKYRGLAQDCHFGNSVRIPRSDPFIAACLHIYRCLTELQSFPCMDVYDYRPYYDVRVENLRVAMRAHRRWQKKVLWENF